MDKGIPPQIKFRDDEYWNDPVISPLGTMHRVLAHVTSEVDRTVLGPRNTLPALQVALLRDAETRIYDGGVVLGYLNKLVQLGLLEENHGVYTVTDAGWKQLVN